jgi:fumarylacetoacetate (FAA) hydrolase family protein
MTPDLRSRLTTQASLPVDAARALLVGRAWIPAAGGPTLVLVQGDALLDLSPLAPTSSELLGHPDLVRRIRAANALPRVASLAETLANSDERARDRTRPWLLAP